MPGGQPAGPEPVERIEMLMRRLGQAPLLFDDNGTVRREDAKTLDIAGGKAGHIDPEHQGRRQSGQLARPVGTASDRVTVKDLRREAGKQHAAWLIGKRFLRRRRPEGSPGRAAPRRVAAIKGIDGFAVPAHDEFKMGKG